MGFWAKALNAMRHAAGWGWYGTRGGGGRVRYDYAGEVGLGMQASAVMAPLGWLQRNLPQAPFVVEQREGEGDKIPDHELAQLLERPNSGYSGAHLLQATVFSLLVPTGGNAYWVKVRNGARQVRELWWVPHWLMTPKWPHDGSQFISHYEYRPGGELVRLEPEDVVHFRMGIDPLNPRLGVSPLNSVLPEIWSDMELATFIAALLRNSGIPGLLISPDGPVAANPNDADQVRRYIAEQSTGEKRGSTLVFSAKTKIERIGFNPQELNLTTASDRAEERVCALLGIPTVVVGFHAGLEQTAVGATMREQVKLAWHSCVIPLQMLVAAEVSRSLIPDFETRPEGFDVYFDTSQVEALQEERDKLVDRAVQLFKAGMITHAQARQMVGMESDRTHDIYLRPFGVVEVAGAKRRR